MYEATSNMSKRELLQKLYAMEPKNPKLSSPEDVISTCIQYRNKKVEYFITLNLDNKNNLLKKQVMSKGTVNQSIVFSQEIFKVALRADALGIILCHNHPGGDPQPSKQDLELTSRIHQGCKLLGFNLLDHVIIARHGDFSFQQEGLL